MGFSTRFFLGRPGCGSLKVRGLIAATVILLTLLPPRAVGQGPTSTRTSEKILDLQALSQRYRAQSVALRDAALREAGRGGWPVRGITSDGTAFELQGIVDGIPLYYITLNARAALSTRTDIVQQRIGGGAGMVIGVWDQSFVRDTHRELAGRVTLAEGATRGRSDHATGIAGTLIAAGVRPEAKGMAFEARVLSHSWNDDLAEVALAAADGLLFTNHSYGLARGWYQSFGDQLKWGGDVAISKREDYHFGFYDERARDCDELACAAPYCLIVAGAGNDRDDGYPAGTEHLYFDSGQRRWVMSTDARNPDGGAGGYDCLPDGMPIAKNLLVVGAAKGLYAYGGPSDVRMTIFSSWGPTDDGRIKPDIAGVGDIVYTCGGASDSAYNTVGGTSLSAPNVCGSLGLLQDNYRDRRGRPMRAATLKALVLHTAREAGEHPGPDYSYGWGFLDTYAAYELIVADADGERGVIGEMTIDDGRPLTLRYECDGAVPELKVTICWHDPPGTPPRPALDPPDIMLVNDLDLRVNTRTAGYGPWVLDPAHPWRGAAKGNNGCDNVEQVHIAHPSAGVYTVTIDHKGMLAGGSQDVSMIVSGAVRIDTWYVYPDGSGDAAGIGEAVALAADGDKIHVAPGVYHEHDILIDKSLTITGTGGADSTLIDAASEGRCLIIEKTGGAVLVAGFGLVNGEALGGERDGCGGAILCERAEAVIRNCRVSDSEARCGGGIAVAFAEPVIEDCLVAGNEALESGGGVYCFDASPTLERCIVAKNAARIDGGGIFCRLASPRIDRCTISHNGASGKGGGIYIGYGCEPEVNASIISFSSAGGGVYCYPPQSDVTLHCCNVFGNTDRDYGGAILDRTGRDGNASSDPLFCDPDCLRFGIGTTSPCRADRNACNMLIGAAGVGCITGTTCRVEPDGTGDMPTIQAAIDAVAEGDTVVLAPGAYRGPGNRNLSFRGKAILVRSDSHGGEVTIDCTDISGDPCCGFDFSHGEDTSSVLERIIIIYAARGGILCTNGSSPTIRQCTVRECKRAGESPGGGIYIENAAPRILNTSLVDNMRSGNGGGIECVHSSPYLSGCGFNWNTSAGDGGGMSITGGSSVTMRDIRFYENMAESGDGGGIYCDSSSVELVDCEMWHNGAQRGGGVFCGEAKHFSVARSKFSGNIAAGVGGSIWCGSRAFIENSTIMYNTSLEHGAGIACADGDSVGVTRTIVAFNRETEGIYTEKNDIDAACCDFFGNEGGDYGGATADLTGTRDNISADPDFCDYGSGIYDTSPCAPANSPCGGLIGAEEVGCGTFPDLEVTKVIISETNPLVGEAINAYVEVKNKGRARADTFHIDLYYNDRVAHLLGREGDRRCLVADGLAVGDSVLCAFMGITNDTPEEWEMLAAADVDGMVEELSEWNNAWGGHRIVWRSDVIIPAMTRLRAICPNPTSGETAIRFDLHRELPVTLAIYDVTGRRICTLRENAPTPAGQREIAWNGFTDGGRAAATGIYFCRFVAGNIDHTRKLILLR